MTLLAKALGLSVLPIIGLFFVWLLGEAAVNAGLGYIMMGLLLIVMSIASWASLIFFGICLKDAFSKKSVHAHHGHGPVKKPAVALAVTANTAYQPGDWRKVLEPPPRAGRSRGRTR